MLGEELDPRRRPGVRLAQRPRQGVEREAERPRRVVVERSEVVGGVPLDGRGVRGVARDVFEDEEVRPGSHDGGDRQGGVPREEAEHPRLRLERRLARLRHERLSRVEVDAVDGPDHPPVEFFDCGDRRADGAGDPSCNRVRLGHVRTSRERDLTLSAHPAARRDDPRRARQV